MATYLISVLAHHYGSEVDLDRIWLQQDISEPLKDALRGLAVQVNTVLHQSANGKMISEWAKKPECWDTVRSAAYPPLSTGIPERKVQTPFA